MVHSKLGEEPHSARDAKAWRASLDKFKQQVDEVNVKINKFNLIVPLMNKQQMPYSAGREVKKVLDNVEEYLPEEDEGAGLAWDVSERELPSPVTAPALNIDWGQVWHDIKKVFTSSRDKQI